MTENGKTKRINTKDSLRLSVNETPGVSVLASSPTRVKTNRLVFKSRYTQSLSVKLVKPEKSIFTSSFTPQSK